MRDVLVVGGGVSGLATALQLARSASEGNGGQRKVTLLEADEILGGWIGTADLSGQAGRRAGPVDIGPDSLLVRSDAVLRLLQSIGLAEEMRSPAAGGAYIWTDDGLVPLPKSSVFGVPDSPFALRQDGLIGVGGMLRAAADLVLPKTDLGDDPTIEELLRPRLGDEVFHTLVEPMLGGVHAGRADRLSAKSAVPDVYAAVAGKRSVIRAVHGMEPRTGAGPGLAGFRGGMSRLSAALADAAVRHGVTIRKDAAVRSLTRHEGRYRIQADHVGVMDADTVVLAVPARVSASLLREIAPRAADVAAQIDYASVATVLLALDPARVSLPPGTGFLVPPIRRKLLVGCTWLSAKWPYETPAADDAVMIRGMVGRDGDTRWSKLSDAELVEAVLDEFGQALASAPGAVRSRLDASALLASLVTRMPDAMPQYTVGHEAQVGAIERNLQATAPGVYVTGASYHGVGLAACLIDAERVAAEIIGAS